MDLEKPLFQATLGDLEQLLTEVLGSQTLLDRIEQLPSKKTYVYGIAGIAKLFGCSIPTAQRIKSSGAIDQAISQIGKILVVDADYAIDLLRIDLKWRNKTKIWKSSSNHK